MPLRPFYFHFIPNEGQCFHRGLTCRHWISHQSGNALWWSTSDVSTARTTSSSSPAPRGLSLDPYCCCKYSLRLYDDLWRSYYEIELTHILSINNINNSNNIKYCHHHYHQMFPLVSVLYFCLLFLYLISLYHHVNRLSFLSQLLATLSPFLFIYFPQEYGTPSTVS